MSEDSRIADHLKELVARTQIHDALMRYCRGVDRLDREMMLSAYHPGARDSHGSFEGPVEEFVEWVIERHRDRIISCTHFVGNTLMKFEGDAAYCESYVIAMHRLSIDGVLQDMTGVARYIDRFEPREGHWKIADRVVVFDKDRLDPVVAQWNGPLTQALLKGTRDRQDASYRCL